MKNINILIYDEENIIYKKGECVSFSAESEPVETTCSDSPARTFIPSMTAVLNCVIANYEELDNIKLDDTTMKRIAKFNKDIDIKKWDEKIEAKKDKIKELDNLLKDKEKRWDKVKEYIAKIYEIDPDDYGDDYDY